VFFFVVVVIDVVSLFVCHLHKHQAPIESDEILHNACRCDEKLLGTIDLKYNNVITLQDYMILESVISDDEQGRK